jgi:hypothetical protein
MNSCSSGDVGMGGGELESSRPANYQNFAILLKKKNYYNAWRWKRTDSGFAAGSCIIDRQWTGRSRTALSRDVMGLGFGWWLS